ncbi:MAG TPA: hypothetical protein VF600_13655 [Abditibacteriaceae bacterium]|jgi:hypothetical protein
MKHLYLLLSLIFFLTLQIPPICAQEVAIVQFSGLARACAGGVADETHTIRLQVKFSGQAAQEVRFVLENAAAHFVADDGALVETQTRSLVPGEDVEVRIRSGNRAETPFLIARRKDGQEIGRLQLDFGLPVLYRRFSDNKTNQYQPQNDVGFLISQDNNSAKYYLKFKKDTARGDVNGNWAPVIGHELQIFPWESDGTLYKTQRITTPMELAQYVRVINPDEPEAKQCILTTRADGSVLFRLQYGSKKGGVYVLTADDLTAPYNEDYRSPDTPLSQALPEYSQIEKPQWMEVPVDLSLRILWHVLEQVPAKNTTPFAWKDARGGNWSEDRSLEVPDNNTNTSPFRFSSDANHVLFKLINPNPVSPSDWCYDLAISDLRDGTTRRLIECVFASEPSPDGKNLAAVFGSLGNSQEPFVPQFSTSVVGIGIPKFAIHGGGNLVWTKVGDLLETEVSYTDDTADVRLGRIRQTPNISRTSYNAAAPAKTTWQTYAASPVPSPDGRHIAFVGPELAADGTWRDTSPVLHIANDDGTQRRALTRIYAPGEWYYPLHMNSPGEKQSAYWSPDGETLYSWSFHTSIKEPSTSGGKALLNKTIPVELQLTAYDAESGAKRNISAFKATYTRWSKYDFPELSDFKALGVSRNGKYFLFARTKRILEKNIDKVAASLHAIRVSDGNLFTLAVLNNSFEVAPL